MNMPLKTHGTLSTQNSKQWPVFTHKQQKTKSLADFLANQKTQ
jgi:hypothetical protein